MKSGIWVGLSRVVGLLLELLLSVFLTLTLAPPLLIIFLLNEVSRCVVRLLLLYKENGRVRLLTQGADAIWAYKRKGNSRNVLILYVYNSQISLSQFRKLYVERVLEYVDTKTGSRPYSKLEEVLVKRWGYYCWARPNHFDITQHVRLANTPNPEAVMTESDVLQLLGTLTEDMSPIRPQWEEIIIPNFRYDQTPADDNVPRSARIWRAHHAYMDGGSNLLMTGHCMGSEGEPGPFPYLVDPLAASRVPLWKEILFNGWAILLGLTTLLRNLYEASQIRSRFLMRRNYSGKQRFGWSTPIHIPVLKAIRDKTRTNLPTLLGSLALSALHEAETLNETVPLDGHNSIKRRGTLGLVGAMLPYPDIQPSNRFTVVNLFSGGTADENRVARLLQTKRDMAALLRRPDALVNYSVFRLIGKFPAFVVDLMMDGGCMAVVFSNVPWASRKVRLWGHEVEEVAGWMPLLTTAGVGLLTVSYCDKMRFCVIGDEKCLSEAEMHRLLAQLTKEVSLLSSECQSLNLNNQQMESQGTDDDDPANLDPTQTNDNLLHKIVTL